MKSYVFNLKAEKTKTIELPSHFSTPIRPDLIHKACLVIQANKAQPYGASPTAGQRYSSKLSRRRRNYKTSYGHGMSRVPRKVTWHRGRHFGFVGATAPGTVGGRRAHPPKAEKITNLLINIKERKKAICSAIAATINKEYLTQKGFSSFNNLPLIIEKDIENISKTKDLKLLLKSFKLDKELERTYNKTIRAGKGKTRGRKYKTKKGILFVVSSSCPLVNSIQNLPGFETCIVDNLNADILAPGALPGRLVVWSLPSIEKLEKEKLFLLDKPKSSQKKEKSKDIKKPEVKKKIIKKKVNKK